MFAYVGRAFLGLLPEAKNWYEAQVIYNDPAMQPAFEKFKIDGLRFGFVEDNCSCPVRALGSVQFGHPSILINPKTAGPLFEAAEFITQHEIVHIQHADADILNLLFGMVACGTSMALRYRGVLSGAQNRIKRIWHSVCKESFSIGMGAMALIGYSRFVEKRADVIAARQCSVEERKAAIKINQCLLERYKRHRNEQNDLEQLHTDIQREQLQLKIEIDRLQDLYSPTLKQQQNAKKIAEDHLSEAKKILQIRKNCISMFIRETGMPPRAMIFKDGIVEEMSSEEHVQQLQKDLVLAQAKCREANKKMDSCEAELNEEIQKAEKETASKIDQIKIKHHFRALLARILIAPNGDDRTDLLHPPLSSRIRWLEDSLNNRN